MRRIRRGVATLGRGLGALVAPFRPAPGTTEGAVLLGLLLVAAGLALTDYAPLALIIPGAVIAGLGVLPALVKVVTDVRSVR